MGVIVIVGLDNEDNINENDNEDINEEKNDNYEINIYEEMKKIANNKNIKYDKFRENTSKINNNEIYSNKQYVASKPIPIPNTKYTN
jgi:hypothetical protein